MNRIIDFLLISLFVSVLYPLYVKKVNVDRDHFVTEMKVENTKVIRMIDMMLTMEKAGQKVCLSSEINLEDISVVEMSLFAELTMGHFSWANNLDTCDYVLHYGHGYMSGTRTYSTMYVEYTSMEDIAELFPGQHHLSISCRVSTYSSVGNQQDFGDYNADWTQFFPSNRVANLDFLSPPNMYTTNGFF
jgi:hypothetical protein